MLMTRPAVHYSTSEMFEMVHTVHLQFHTPDVQYNSENVSSTKRQTFRLGQ